MLGAKNENKQIHPKLTSERDMASSPWNTAMWTSGPQRRTPVLTARSPPAVRRGLSTTAFACLPMFGWRSNRTRPRNARALQIPDPPPLTHHSTRNRHEQSPSIELTRSAGRADREIERHGSGLDGGVGRRGRAGVVGVQRAGAPRLAPIRRRPAAARAGRARPGLQVPRREPRRDEAAPRRGRPRHAGRRRPRLRPHGAAAPPQVDLALRYVRACLTRPIHR
jgi:hypothetical protein